MKAIIVDDEKHVREGLLLLADWKKYGIYHVYEAEDGEEAIKKITQFQPEIIFTDMKMPKRDGINLLKWLYESNLPCKTIIVSGYNDFNYMRNAIYYKSFDYLLKPIDQDILNETLERVVMEWLDDRTAYENDEFDIEVQREKNSVQKIEEYLRDNYQMDINLQEIADRFYLSREYISRRFKQEYKETITDYLTKIRIEKARELLRNPSIKIYEIAYHVGYQDEKYFSKVFKKITGVTPNEYRNSTSIKRWK